jgi:hypothetical protein
MNKAGKIFLFSLSIFPLLWTIIILIAAYFHIHLLKGLLLGSGIIYYYFGSVTWLILLIFIGWKKKITAKEIIISICLMLLGIFTAYYSISHDIFNVRGGYID